ncbi:hypothetical protein BABINDRAFT_175558 [Babjeviella inositovora NRRL Y-12698]|uniref:Chromatin assembly factor 1 subunit A n=1 Tax=Babjeviella inositovora NRRL Y-12698 TaxID=984486 RepID=A0A1E3QR44_9ASCO|nr:uncharacterized protein BABINDRAFT_175558 [Babjeviella inositovora NRRL Y-12698]ODQ80120.1 hypothetical protein BABINDRAFT_175558 [Babjeviella inositovora NRRL Y-12698]
MAQSIVSMMKNAGGPPASDSVVIDITASSPVEIGPPSPVDVTPSDSHTMPDLSLPLTPEEKQQKKNAEQTEKDLKLKQKETERKRKLSIRDSEREAKRRKLEEEKEARRLKFEEDKKLREQKKEEERLKRIADREQKERERLERKRALEEEKETKKRLIEEEKENKRRKVEEERKRKEEAKLRAEEDKRKAEETASRKQLRIASFFTVTKPKQQAEAESDYQKTFLPFYLKENCYLPASGQLPALRLADSKRELDTGALSLLADFFRGSKQCHSRIPERATPREIIQLMNTSQNVSSMLALLPVKVLCFYENVGPPYLGTFSKPIPVAYKRTPFFTEGTDFDYDYDSDMEWELENEDGEGEDLGEDEDDISDNDPGTDSDMDDFVDENDAEGRLVKRKIIGPLVPVVEWNQGTLEELQYEGLSLAVDFPINPFRDYWKKPEVPDVSPNREVTPRTPTLLTPLKKPKPMITETKDLVALCGFIEANNDFTIGTLCELAKKQFGNYSKVVIKNTIDSIATKVKNSERKWEIDEAYLKKLHVVPEST